MKEMIRDIDRLDDIIEQINFIEEHTDIEEKYFFNSKVLQLALLKSLEIIGEASNQISRVTKGKYPGIDWSEMVKARNYYVHEYFAVDWKWVWKSIKSDIDFKKLKDYCATISEELKKQL